jgi:hypothetical protein
MHLADEQRRLLKAVLHGASPGLGMSLPDSCIAATHAARASFPFAIASLDVSPSEIQPGRSGNAINQPPPFLFRKGMYFKRIIKGFAQRHFLGCETPYVFMSIEQLIHDFMGDIQQVRNE